MKARYVIAKQHEGGRTWRTVIMDTTRANAIIWRAKQPGWTKATRAEAQRMLPLLDPPKGLQRMMTF